MPQTRVSVNKISCVHFTHIFTNVGKKSQILPMKHSYQRNLL